MEAKIKALTEAYAVIVNHLRGNTRDKKLVENFKGTEARCVKALLANCLSDAEIAERIKEVIKTSFPVHRNGTDMGGMITQGPIALNSMCPHHLMPVRYSAYVSYLPNDTVLGLSKLTRLSKLLAMRPVLHEQLALDIASVLYSNDVNEEAFPSIRSQGSAVMLVGTHTCMSCRGVEEDTKTGVVELRGAFWEVGVEEKFYQAVNAIKTGHPFR